MVSEFYFHKCIILSTILVCAVFHTDLSFMQKELSFCVKKKFVYTKRFILSVCLIWNEKVYSPTPEFKILNLHNMISTERKHIY